MISGRERPRLYFYGADYRIGNTIIAIDMGGHPGRKAIPWRQVKPSTSSQAT